MFKALAIISCIILLHELGHYLAARVFGLHVSEFSIGFGPVIVSYTVNNTLWSIKAIPFGGYVAIDNDMLDKVTIWRKLIIFTAGPLANLLSAFCMLIGYCMLMTDMPLTSSPQQSSHISSIQLAHASHVSTHDRPNASSKNTRLATSTYAALHLMKREIANFVQLPKLIYKNGVRGIVGPIGIMKQAARVDSWKQILFFMAKISIALGLFNLLPIPGLDGGQVLTALLPLSAPALKIISYVGLGAIGLLMLVVTAQDIVRIFST